MSKLFDAKLYEIKSDCETGYPKTDFEKGKTQCPIKKSFPFKIVQPKKIKWYKSASAIMLYLVQIALLISAVVLILINWVK
jgi:hypothetical protein